MRCREVMESCDRTVSPGERTILHVDMDAFFASVEIRENPVLAGRPVVVGADPRGGHGRGVVAAASYEARAFGIHSAQPISEAHRRCPHATFLRPRGSLYREVSREVFEILLRYTDLVEPLGIDEAFLDVTACRRLFGDGRAIARRIREDIREEQNLTASVGVARSKFVAKLASDLQKPDGLVVVEPERERAFLAEQPVARLWGAGPRAVDRFERMGLRTIGEVAGTPLPTLVGAFGEAAGRRFHALARGEDERPVVPGRARKSLGKEFTFPRNLQDRSVVRRRLLLLCEETARSLRRHGIAGSTITLKLRWEGFETATRQKRLDRSVQTTEPIWQVARTFFAELDRPERRIRLVGVSLSDLVEEGERQLSLFRDRDEARTERVAEAVDHLLERFGRSALTRAALLPTPEEDDGKASPSRESPETGDS